MLRIISILLSLSFIISAQDAIKIPNLCQTYTCSQQGYYVNVNNNCNCAPCMVGCEECVNGNSCSRCKEGTTFYAGVLTELGPGPKCVTFDELYSIFKLYGVPIGCSVSNSGQCPIKQILIREKQIIMIKIIVFLLIIHPCYLAIIPIPYNCSDIILPYGHFTDKQNNCKITPCPVGCLKCNHQVHCEICQPDSYFYMGELPMAFQGQRCISGWEADLIKIMKWPP